MATQQFMEMLEARFAAQKLVCIGLDSDMAKLPAVIREEYASPEEALFIFNRRIIDATADLASAFKPNAAFYEAEGEAGHRALRRTADYLKEHYPDIPLILDAKRADIGNTNEGYVRAVFDEIGADAVTVHPYLGKEALEPFLARKDKGVFVLAKTSNPGSGEFQDLLVDGEPLYQRVARNAATGWNGNGNCGLVVGATYPEELKKVRAIVGDMPILVPGIGAQGGDVVATISAGKGKSSFGLVINSSRGILYASHGEDFAEAARTATEVLSGSIRDALVREDR